MKKMLLIIIYVICIVVTAGCTTHRSEKPSQNTVSHFSTNTPSYLQTPMKTPIASSAQKAEMGNTMENIRNKGMAVADSQAIYFANDLGIYKMNKEGSKIELLVKDKDNGSKVLPFTNLNVMNGWLYFLWFDGIDGDGLYKVKTDGTNLQNIFDNSGINFVVVGDWIIINSGGIFLIKTDGSSLKQISAEYASDLVVFEETIYTLSEDQRSIYKMKMDGTGKTKIFQPSDAKLLIYCDMTKIIDGFMYIKCFDKSYAQENVRLKLDDLSQKILPDDKYDVYAFSFNITHDWAYDLFEKTRLDNGQTIKFDVKEENSSEVTISVAGDWLFYRYNNANLSQDKGDNYVYRMIKADGTQYREIDNPKVETVE